MNNLAVFSKIRGLALIKFMLDSRVSSGRGEFSKDIRDSKWDIDNDCGQRPWIISGVEGIPMSVNIV